MEQEKWIREAIDRGITETDGIREYIRQAHRIGLSNIIVGKVRAKVMRENKNLEQTKSKDTVNVDLRLNTEKSVAETRKERRAKLFKHLKDLLVLHTEEEIRDMLELVVAVN